VEESEQRAEEATGGVHVQAARSRWLR
jgi:hypothetical protein